MLASIEIEDRRFDAAGSLLEEGLKIFAEVRDVTGILFALPPLAALALEHGDPERAVRLIGAAARLRETSGATVIDLARQNLPELEDTFKALSPERAQQLIFEGQAMSVEQIVTYALGRAQS